ncbi:hypothetical protein D3C79_407130 [compost metagenome]
MEIHRQHPVHRADRLQRAVIDLQHRRGFPLLPRQLDEHPVHGVSGLTVERRQVQMRLSQSTQTVIDTGIDVHHIAVVVNQGNRRQETRTLQAIAVQIVRRNIRRCHQRDAARKQRLQQRGQQHRVGDVGNEEFVKTHYVGLRLETVGDDVQRVLLPLQLGQLFMHPQHKAVEVQTQFALSRQAVEEHVHQPGFTAPDPTPHIQPLHRASAGRFIALAKPAAELAAQSTGRHACRGYLLQCQINALKPGNRLALNLIGLIFPRLQRLLVA